MSKYRIAVLIPCYNEDLTIHRVVRDFFKVLPDAIVYVYDNNSNDNTAKYANAAGAVVRRESLQGKGNVVRRMFADIDSDVYVLVDGDNTYDANIVTHMIDLLILEHFDMVSGARKTDMQEAFRAGHRFGNKLLTRIVCLIFRQKIGDMLSGYRVLSRRFVKSFPAESRGFEIETELTVHALQLRLPITELQTFYKNRPSGSESKLNTITDGIRILWMIFVLIKEERPLQLFFSLAAIFAVTAVTLAWPLFETYYETGLVLRLPTAILSTGLMLLSFLSLACGLILDTVTHGRREIKRLHYLAMSTSFAADGQYDSNTTPQRGDPVVDPHKQ